MANSEVLDLVNNTLSCQNLAPFAKRTYGATGGLVDGVPLICGGYGSGYSDECYRITKAQTSLVTTMSSQRLYAASVALENKLWVMGGWSGSIYHITSEYIETSGTTSGPNLPYGVERHAAVAWNSTSFMLIGGSSSSSYYLSKTFYYHGDNPGWIPGPDMNQARFHHSAALGMDQATNDPYIAVTGGYKSGNLDSVELLYEGETEWQAGKHQ